MNRGKRIHQGLDKWIADDQSFQREQDQSQTGHQVVRTLGLLGKDRGVDGPGGSIDQGFKCRSFVIGN